MAKKNLFFCGHKQNDRGSDYLHAEIYVFDANPYASSWDGVKFAWQANRDGGHEGRWYAFSVEIEARSVLQLNQKVSMARRVMGKEMGSETTPDAILDKLSKIAVEVVYDPRINQYVPQDEVLPESMVAWRDDWYTMGKSSCTVGCLAETREEAQDLILLELAKNGHYQEYMIKWLQAGKPVRCLDDRQPDMQTVREKLALNG